MTDILHETKPNTDSKLVIKLQGWINLASNVNTARAFDMRQICHYVYVKTNTFQI
jgi:hypothetical protein